MSGDTIADRRVHPATVPLRVLKESPGTLIGLPAAFAFLSDYGLLPILGVAAGVLLMMGAANYALWRSFRYGIGARDLVIEKGILTRTRRSIPFDRVQDIDLERGPLQRLFGLAKVRLETAGGGKDEGTLDSVTLVEAERLRAAFRASRRAHTPTAAVDEAPVVTGRLIHALPFDRLLMSGLFNFSLLYLAGLFAILQAFEPYLPFDLYDPARWTGLVDAGSEAGWLSPGPIAAVALLALALGIATGVVTIVARNFGFRLTLDDDARFRRERGLLTRSEIVIPKRRIQAAAVDTGPVRRLLDAHHLAFQTLSVGRDKSGHQTVAPFARGGDVAGILAEAGRYRLPAPDEMRRVSRKSVLVVLALELAVPLPAILVASLFAPPAIMLLGVLPVPLAAAFLSRHFHRYALADGLLFVQRGFWKQKTHIIPLARGQAVRMKRGFVQRRLGLASLVFDTAGASAMGSPWIEDMKASEAEALRNALAGGIHASGRKSGTDR